MNQQQRDTITSVLAVIAIIVLIILAMLGQGCVGPIVEVRGDCDVVAKLAPGLGVEVHCAGDCIDALPCNAGCEVCVTVPLMGRLCAEVDR